MKFSIFCILQNGATLLFYLIYFLFPYCCVLLKKLLKIISIKLKMAFKHPNFILISNLNKSNSQQFA